MSDIEVEFFGEARHSETRAYRQNFGDRYVDDITGLWQSAINSRIDPDSGEPYGD